MIISHKHKYIFIHSFKTAGSSISTELIQHSGPHDEYIGSIPESYKAKTLRKFDYIKGIELEKQILFFIKTSIFRRSFGQALSLAGKKYYMKKGLHSHSTWKDINDYLGNETYENYFTFAFERNPWDKAVSAYHWLGKNYDLSKFPFSDFVKGYVNNFNIFAEKPILHCLDYNVYSDGKDLKVDYLARFEDLENEMQYICNYINLPFQSLSRAKHSKHRKDNFKSYYNQESKELIEKRFAYEIHLLNYTF